MLPYYQSKGYYTQNMDKYITYDVEESERSSSWGRITNYVLTAD